MKFLRNKEIRCFIAIYAAFAVIFSVLAMFTDVKAFIFTAASLTVAFIVCIVFEKKRYDKISELSSEIDKILYNQKEVKFDRYCEGELAILCDEIYKMTSRLKEQKEKILEDKIYLADSMADISHQIRTPLTSINLIVSLLAQDNIKSERKSELISDLYGLIYHIDWLVSVLLKISKLDAGTVTFSKDEVLLDELIKKACDSLLIPIELRGLKLIISANGNFCGDISWTSEAIANIVKNCMEHTPSGGTLVIEALENPIYTQIVISDDGTGICREDLPHIFERFYKGKKSSESSVGIGLALSRMIITNQGGTIKAVSDGKSGSKFIIKFYKGAV